MNMVGLILLIFFIFIINSYFCGKIIKRYSKEINDFLSIVFGFFIFIGGLQIFIVPIMIIDINVNIFLISFLTYQSILLIIYGINWRFSLSKMFITWQQLLIALIGIILILLIIFGFNNYNNDSPLVVHQDNLLNYNNKQYIVDGLIVVFADKLNVDQINIVYAHAFNLIFAIIISFGIFGMYFYDRTIKFYKTITFLVIVTIISVCSLSIFTSPSNGNSWILFSIILLIFNHIININNKNYKFGITNINLITLGLFALCPDSLYVIIMTNLYLLFMAFHYKFKNVMDYNIRGLFGCILSICLFIKLNTDTFFVWIGIYILIILYVLYYIIRNTKVMNPINKFFDNVSMNTIKFLTILFALIVFLVGMLIITIPGDFQFDSAPWIITQFMNKNLVYGTWLFWLVNILYYIINGLLIVYAILTYTNKKIQSYIENIKLTPLIGINTMTFWNPISTNFWSSISFGNIQAISNGFINSFSSAMINFIYYLINKPKWSKSLTIFAAGSGMVTIGLVLINLLV